MSEDQPTIHFFACTSNDQPWKPFFYADQLTTTECEILVSALGRFVGNYVSDKKIAIKAVSATSDPAWFLDLAFLYSATCLDEKAVAAYGDVPEMLFQLACEHQAKLFEIRVAGKSASYLVVHFGRVEGQVFNRIVGLGEAEKHSLDSVLTDEVKGRGGIYRRHDDYALQTNAKLLLRLTKQWENLSNRAEQGKLTEFEAWAVARSNALVEQLLKLRAPISGAVPPTPSVKPVESTGRRRRLTINVRMIDAIQQDPSRKGWSAGQFATFLGCSKSTVHETATWRSLKVVKASLKIERLEKEKKEGEGRRRRAGKKRPNDSA